MQGPRLLVFDLDGTLIDSSLDLCNSVNAAMRGVGKSPLPNAVIAGYIGDGAAMLVRRALGDPGDLDAGNADAGDALFHRAFDLFLAHYREHKLDNTQCYEGVLEALALIRERQPHLPMAVLTNKPVNPSRQICEALGLAPFFFQNYGGNSFTTKKPDPEGLLTIAREADALLRMRDYSAAPLASGEVVMIGDSDVDVLTGRRIGARTVGCLFGLAPHTLHAAQPDRMVEHPSEWPAALGL
ncbi:MAG TPA: HAD hydrolase-like protein [Candidatus Aquilonibacter sp.]|nr:HAD hydrolase-like protein [Candidatus Aquilonibacter sp.]